jgi:signal transduction histidine kinase/ActR/RegA family two-component response regulator
MVTPLRRAAPTVRYERGTCAIIIVNLPSVTAAQRSINRASVETWLDGRRYVTGYAKSDGYRSFPGLGWIVLVREDADMALLPATNLQRQVVALALASVLAAALAAWLLADRLAAPLLNLSRAAERVRRGENIEIPSVSGYAEAEILSESLRSLVAELQARQDTLSRLNASLEDEVAVRTSELAEQNTALAAAKETAEQATAAKSRFLAAASHDLRQPLHALILFARALSRRVQGDEAQRLVRQMEEALASLRTMFDALLNISRLDAGLVSPQKVTFDIGQHIETISAGFRAEAHARGLEFRTRTTSASVTTDAAILETMVRNLVSNAFKFTKSGGVLLSTRRRGNRIAIEIYDTGPGISATDADAIFQEFHRARHQAVGPNDGLGLGLSIVRRYARLLGVDVTMRARPGHGTCFRLVLPLSDPVPAPSTEAVHLPEARPPASILVLDDDALIVAALVRELSDHGHAVQGFAIAAAAEAALKSGVPFDVVVADHDLGGAETGTAFIARMETELGRPVPTLILSGATDAATLSMLTRTGRPWLTKPADSRAITDAIAKLTRTPTGPSRQPAAATA